MVADFFRFNIFVIFFARFLYTVNYSVTVRASELFLNAVLVLSLILCIFH